MIHRPWPYTRRLIDRMADSSLLDAGFELSKRPPRSPGLHCSTLLHQLHPRKKQSGEGISEDELRLYGLMGLAFEDRAELALLSLSQDADWPWHCFRTPEVEQDGIACSPDILLVPKDLGETKELSIKVGWDSCKRLPRDEEGEDGFPGAPTKWPYRIDQCLAYCTPLDTLSAVLVCFFVNGDYDGNRVPQVHGWEFEFSEQERSETWQALLGLAEDQR
jgi:hypothetical protein